MDKRLTIGAVIGNANSPHTRDMMSGIQNAADKYDLNVIYLLGVHMESTFNSYFSNKHEFGFDYQYNVVYDYALLADCDALIISYGSICIFLDDLDKNNFLSKFRSVPYVLCEDRDDLGIGSSIISNNFDGMTRLVEHLISVHKYSRFAFMGGPAWNTDAIERRKAFEHVLTLHGIELRDEMFEYGDFSARVESQVNNLLNNNPDVQAIVCANDVMADTVYKECARRGLVVGKDIAVTGYDDWDAAASMAPPLTTVMQNGFDMGYTAVKKAIALVEKRIPEEDFVSTVVKIRGSCGCKASNRYNFPKKNLETRYTQMYVEGILKALVSKCISSTANKSVRERIADTLRPLIVEAIDGLNKSATFKVDKKQLMNELSNIFEGEFSEFISYIDLGEAVGALLSDRITTETDPKRIVILTDIMTTVQKNIQAYVSKNSKDEINKYQNDTMFMPYISRDMMIHIDDEEEFYGSAVNMIAYMGVHSAYIFLLEQPVLHKKGADWHVPETMRLAAYQVAGDVITFDPDSRPVLSHDKQMSYYFRRNDRYRMSVYDIFMGETQYGVLVTETNPESMLLMNLASLQISSGISFRELYVEQQALHRQLEKMVTEIQEKNKVLGFISEYDQMTGCLNRRGYIEQAKTLMTENRGEKAVVLVSDLDHLKEINDTFGHAEGDFAIRSSAEILRRALGRDTIVARLGGDEFIAIYHEDEEFTGEELIGRIKKANEEFEANCDKPYYVEISVGYYEFICDESLELSDLMKEADKVLYEAKKLRRKSIQKANN